MGNLIVYRVQSREIQQISYRPRQSWGAGNSDSPRTPPIPSQKRSCAFLKIHQNPRFPVSPPMNPGTWPQPLHLPRRAPMCNRAAFLFKTLHFVQIAIDCRALRPAWAEGSFALHSNLHKKRTQGPSAGGG